MEDVKNLVNTLNKYPLRTVFKAVVTFYEGDADYDITEEDNKLLEDLYDYYLRNDNITSIINEDIIEEFDKLREGGDQNLEED